MGTHQQTKQTYRQIDKNVEDNWTDRQANR